MLPEFSAGDLIRRATDVLQTGGTVAVLGNDRSKCGKPRFGTDSWLHGSDCLAGLKMPIVSIRAAISTHGIVEQIKAVDPSTLCLL